MRQKSDVQHVFLVGAKNIGAYGGYETFVDKLIDYHKDNPNIQYHVACKANGEGRMDENVLDNVTVISESEFVYHNARCFKIKLPNIGSAQAIYYDIAALKECCEYIEAHNLQHPIVYIMACRIGPFAKYYHKRIMAYGGRVFVNPDGHEWKRAKWSAPVRKYWKISERLMVKNCDLVICDSVNIQKYIQENYGEYSPRTTFIAYGAETRRSRLSDDDPKLLNWYAEKGLSKKDYYLIVGRFVPENNFETMIREFMKSHSAKRLAIITTANPAFLEKLESTLKFSSDGRIKFVGTVYDHELLMKIRENACGYLHGHEVGGTNPSLLEALGSTDLNLLLDVGFNREVGEDAALYWSREDDSLAALVDRADLMSDAEKADFGRRAKARISEAYSWKYITDRYESVFLDSGI